MSYLEDFFRLSMRWRFSYAYQQRKFLFISTLLMGNRYHTFYFWITVLSLYMYMTMWHINTISVLQLQWQLQHLPVRSPHICHRSALVWLLTFRTEGSHNWITETLALLSKSTWKCSIKEVWAMGVLIFRGVGHFKISFKIMFRPITINVRFGVWVWKPFPAVTCPVVTGFYQGFKKATTPSQLFSSYSQTLYGSNLAAMALYS